MQVLFLCIMDWFVVVRVVDCVRSLCVFFFKQKTAYEMRISDWSSDVCSSDLVATDPAAGGFHQSQRGVGGDRRIDRAAATFEHKIGRASCRERVVSTCRSRWSPYH